MSIYNVPHPSNHYLQCHELLSEEYFETSWYVTLPFSMFSLCCHNTLHHFLHFAETLADSNLFFQQFSVFLKGLLLRQLSRSIFCYERYLSCILDTIITLYWAVSQTTIFYTPNQSFRTSNWMQEIVMQLVKTSWQLLNISEKEQQSLNITLRKEMEITEG